jgi:hypothetical protein
MERIAVFWGANGRALVFKERADCRYSEQMASGWRDTLGTSFDKLGTGRIFRCHPATAGKLRGRGRLLDMARDTRAQADRPTGP